MTGLHPAAFLEASAHHKVAYVLIGGYAAMTPGADLQSILIDLALTAPPNATETRLAHAATSRQPTSRRADPLVDESGA